MEKITYSPQVEQYLNDLTDVLFEKEYFSYLENSIKYVQRLTDDIAKFIDVKKHKKAPYSLSKYGKYYASFSVNKHTTWYIVFDKLDSFYNINYITNNHSPDAALLKDL